MGFASAYEHHQHPGARSRRMQICRLAVRGLARTPGLDRRAAVPKRHLRRCRSSGGPGAAVPSAKPSPTGRRGESGGLPVPGERDGHGCDTGRRLRPHRGGALRASRRAGRPAPAATAQLTHARVATARRRSGQRSRVRSSRGGLLPVAPLKDRQRAPDRRITEIWHRRPHAFGVGVRQQRQTIARRHRHEARGAILPLQEVDQAAIKIVGRSFRAAEARRHRRRDDEGRPRRAQLGQRFTLPIPCVEKGAKKGIERGCSASRCGVVPRTESVARSRRRKPSRQDGCARR